MGGVTQNSKEIELDQGTIKLKVKLKSISLATILPGIEEIILTREMFQAQDLMNIKMLSSSMEASKTPAMDSVKS